MSHTANHLDTVSEVTTRPDTEKKKKRRKKRSKDAISQSFSSASRDIVNEIKGVHVDSVDATPESLPVENLGIPSSTEASQKGNFIAFCFLLRSNLSHQLIMSFLMTLFLV